MIPSGLFSSAGITLIQQLPLQLFFTVWCGGFFGAFASMYFHPSGDLAPSIIIGAITFVVFPIAVYMARSSTISAPSIASTKQAGVREGFSASTARSFTFAT